MMRNFASVILAAVALTCLVAFVSAMPTGDGLWRIPEPNADGKIYLSCGHEMPKNGYMCCEKGFQEVLDMMREQHEETATLKPPSYEPDAAALEKIVESIKKPIHENVITEGQKCPICLDGLTDEDWMLCNCEHKYHVECLKEWIRTNWDHGCPICTAPYPRGTEE